MAKHTDRYDNENLITLAKKDYDQTQKNTLPTEIVELASKGNVYPKNHPLRSGKLEMRYMTAYDEDILTNASYIREGVVIEKLLESLIVTDVDVADIPDVDKDGLIITARIVSYGAEYPVKVTDPKTKKSLDRSVNLQELKPKEFNLIPDDNGEFDYEVNSDTSIKFKFLTKNMTDQIQENNAISSFLLHAITQVNDSSKESDIEHFIRYTFLAKDSKAFRDYILKNSPGFEYSYEFEGEDGSTFTAGFQVGADLFWV